MKHALTYFFFIICLCKSFSQINKTSSKSQLIINTEFLFGFSTEANSLFPKRDLQTQFILGFATDNSLNTQEWAYRLKAPKTGVNFGYANFGNLDQLGIAITVMPFIEFDIFNRKQKDLKLFLGLGGSYVTKKYNAINNIFNRAISTDFNWSYRATLFYELMQTKQIKYRVGLTYFHHSNGHTKLPNQGLNSFLAGVSLDIKNPKKALTVNRALEQEAPEKSVYNYFSFRYGLGYNVFSEAYNDKKAVNSLSLEYGKIWNKTLKVGVGLFYRHYSHYQDYIDNNESLVQTGREFKHFKEHPFINASALGLFINGEFLLNHIGIDLQVGANVFKPSYKIDWRINEGWENTPRDIPANWELGEYTNYFKLKHIISTRMRLKYYLIGTDKTPKHNVFIAAHINSNLGQADFSEVSIGYVRGFNKNKPVFSI